MFFLFKDTGEEMLEGESNRRLKKIAYRVAS
jgi:hypothetical protein